MMDAQIYYRRIFAGDKGSPGPVGGFEGVIRRGQRTEVMEKSTIILLVARQMRKSRLYQDLQVCTWSQPPRSRPQKGNKLLD